MSPAHGTCGHSKYVSHIRGRLSFPLGAGCPGPILAATVPPEDFFMGSSRTSRPAGTMVPKLRGPASIRSLGMQMVVETEMGHAAFQVRPRSLEGGIAMYLSVAHTSVERACLWVLQASGQHLSMLGHALSKTSLLGREWQSQGRCSPFALPADTQPEAHRRPCGLCMCEKASEPTQDRPTQG